MSGPEVLDLARDSIWTLIIVSAPLMLVGLIVGVAIAALFLRTARDVIRDARSQLAESDELTRFTTSR